MNLSAEKMRQPSRRDHMASRGARRGTALLLLLLHGNQRSLESGESFIWKYIFGGVKEVVIKFLEMLFSKCHFARNDSKYFNGST